MKVAFVAAWGLMLKRTARDADSTGLSAKKTIRRTEARKINECCSMRVFLPESRLPVEDGEYINTRRTCAKENTANTPYAPMNKGKQLKIGRFFQANQ